MKVPALPHDNKRSQLQLGVNIGLAHSLAEVRLPGGVVLHCCYKQSSFPHIFIFDIPLVAVVLMVQPFDLHIIKQQQTNCKVWFTEIITLQVG